MKLNKWYILAFVLIVAIILANPYIKQYLLSSGPKEAHTNKLEHEAKELPGFVKLQPEQVEEIGLEISQVKQGSLSNEINLTGEIKINEDKLAHIVAYSSGIVKKVNKRLGDYVQKGEVLAVLDAPEISTLQEEYLEAVARLDIAEANFEREKQLLEENLTTQSDFLQSKDDYIRAEHDLHSNERKLKIFGFSIDEISNFEHQHQTSTSYYKIIAPYSGTIIEKRISTGEALEQNARIFSIADISTVWIDFSLYQKDIPFVKASQEISIKVPNLSENIKGVISFVSPLVGENTRTAFARVVLGNSNLSLKPGTFVTGVIDSGNTTGTSLLIKKTAVQEMDGSKVVFLKKDGGFKAQIIQIGEENSGYIEVLSGLSSGQSYVSENSFMLKAEMQKGEMEEGHGH